MGLGIGWWFGRGKFLFRRAGHQRAPSLEKSVVLRVLRSTGGIGFPQNEVPQSRIKPEKLDEGTGVNGENRERKSWERMLGHLLGEPAAQSIRIQPPNPPFSLFPPVQPHVPFQDKRLQ
jgi:hypothetical protein